MVVTTWTKVVKPEEVREATLFGIERRRKVGERIVEWKRLRWIGEREGRDELTARKRK